MFIPIYGNFTVMKLEAKDISIAVTLCERHIGKGMYTDAFFHKMLLLDNHFFYLVYEKDKVVGYFYYLVTAPNDLSDLPELENIGLQELCDKPDVIGICRSIGINIRYRGIKLSDRLLQYFTGILFEQFGVNVVFIPAWVKGSYIPAKRLLEDNNYSFYCNLYAPWINNTELECPYCRKKHCICDAVIYYMKEKTYYENKKALSS